MGNKAVGAYLRRVRELRGISRTKVAAALNTNENQILRIENGENDARASIVLGFVRLVDGSAEHLADLFIRPTTPDEGYRLAEQWIENNPMRLRSLEEDEATL